MKLIFDIDGTLADTALATIPAFRALCKAHNWACPTDAQIRDAIGIANPDFYYHLFPDYPRELVFEVGQQVEAAEESDVFACGEKILFPGVRAMLDALIDMGVTLYVASTGDRAHVSAVLKAGGITELFEAIHCHEPSKENMIARIIDGGDKSDWVMVGDRDKDIKGARANGIKALGAGFGYVRDSDRQLYDMVFEKPNDLVEWVKVRI